MKRCCCCAVLLFLSSGFSTVNAAGSALLEELERARGRWESLRLENYAYVIANDCACADPVQAGPLLVIVENGRIKRAVYLGESRNGYTPGQAVRKRTPLRASIPGLFNYIEKRIRRGNDAHFKIKYDDKAGYPLRVEYDDPALKGEEIRIELKEFKRRA